MNNSEKVLHLTPTQGFELTMTSVESIDNYVIEPTSMVPGPKTQAAGHEGEDCESVTDPGSYNDPGKWPGNV